MVGKHRPATARIKSGYGGQSHCIHRPAAEESDGIKSVLMLQTHRRHLRKPVEFKILLRPILLHVDKYSEYISDRDTEPSELVSKCAFNL